MKLDALISKQEKVLAEDAAMRVLAYGVDTARKLLIKEHNEAKDNATRVRAAIQLRILKNYADA